MCRFFLSVFARVNVSGETDKACLKRQSAPYRRGGEAVNVRTTQLIGCSGKRGGYAPSLPGGICRMRLSSDPHILNIHLGSILFF